MAYDRIRSLKLENPREGGTQLDYNPTEVDPTQDAHDARGYYAQNGTSNDTVVVLDRIGNNMRLTDQVTTRLLSELVSSVQASPNYHSGLLSLIHYLEDGPDDAYASGAQFVRSLTGPLVTSDIWYTDTTLSKKIVAKAYTYTGPLLQSLTYTLYANDGITAARTLKDTYSYVGPVLTTKTRVWS